VSSLKDQIAYINKILRNKSYCAVVFFTTEDTEVTEIKLMIIRMYPITPQRGNEPSAQGSALGDRMFKHRPERAKAIVGSKA